MPKIEPALIYDRYPGAHLAPVQAQEEDLQWWASSAGQSIQDDDRTSVIFRHSGWHRVRRLIAEALYRTDQSFARQQEFKHCGSHAYVLRNCDDPEEYRIAGSCCRDRFCLPCGTERGCIIANNITDLIGTREIRFVTFTIKTHAEPLTQQLDKLYRSFQAIRRRGIWKQRVTGGVALLELKWSNRGDRWHPHLHCLIEGGWIDRKRLQRAWHEITGDSFVVDIRRPPNMQSVTRYVTKYVSKPFNSTFVNEREHLDEAILALKGRKLLVTFGRWRGKQLTSVPHDGTWEKVGDLMYIINRAAQGDEDCRAIMAKLTSRDLTELYARAPPPEPRKPELRESDRQLDWLGTWQHDGTFKYPMHW